MNCTLVNTNFKNNYIKNLLKEKGVTDLNAFLNPDPSCLQTWRDLESMDRAVTLLHNLMGPTATIAIVADCDMDGYCSASMIYQYIKRVEPDVTIKYFIHEGKQHGLEDTLACIVEEKFELIILPDAGSNDSKYAEQLSCPVLVLDHHIVEDENYADNMVVVNNQTSQKYQNKDLCGAGVTYQFCRAYDETYGYNWADDFIDLAGFAIVGDMMSMLSIENQFLVSRAIGGVKNSFLWALLHKQAYSIVGEMNPTDERILQKLTPISIAFYIVPLVNAMIRIGTMEEKERMFEAFINGHKLIPSKKRGANGALEEIATESARECGNARNHQNKIKDDMTERLEIKVHKMGLLDNKILFVRLDDDDNFPPELNGLVCMNLSQRFRRPTIVARLGEDGMIKGSIRGLNNSEFDDFKEFLQYSGYFEYVQGHLNAAGCCIQDKNLADFHEWANKELANFDFSENSFFINFERIAADEDIADLILDIGSYNKIYGQQFDEPRIHITDINVTPSDWQVMGSKKDTLKITKFGISYMKFKANDLIDQLRDCPNAKLEIVGRANINEWMGTKTPQIFIEEYELEDNTYGF